ncbi:hypothetical protein KIN20_003205 [Parelaphostrongylus tenuis]|uniref:Bestrophin homolog n=1 Tax=Parelaphostrongylus tenuis TaxID=148309 RepID=A0AAD5QDJ5_PARTN|nr:hypothetical protein KIN20_003205 [Parelaphostrongylus tenuis]
MESIVTAGFLHENERVELDKIDIVYNKYWAPINWALTLVFRAHKDGHIAAPPSLNSCMSEIKTFRANLAQLCNYDWVPIPIAYPQRLWPTRTSLLGASRSFVSYIKISRRKYLYSIAISPPTEEEGFDKAIQFRITVTLQKEH